MKTDNYIKVLLTSIVILLGIIVVKDIDLPPKAYADLLGNNQKYQLACAYQECILLNTRTGMAKVLQVEPPKNAIKGSQSMTHKYGEISDF
jgi:hypothetical protein